MIISPQCHLIAVMGGKGGVGKSVFAANFAAALMLELRTQVLLLDADAKSCGDQNIILGLRPNKTIGEVAQFVGSLTPQAIPQLVTAHPSGLAYIAAVRGPEEVLNPNVETFMKQLEFLSRHFKFIVADLGNEIKDLQKALMLEATAITIITNPEVLVVNQTQRLINELLTATLPADMFQLIINKAGPTGLAPQAIAQSLRIPVVGVIPNDEATSMGALQRNQPFVISQRSAPITNAYHEIVRKLTGGTLQKLKSMSRASVSAPSSFSGAASLGSGSVDSGNGTDARNALKIRIHTELIKTMDLKKGITETNNDPAKETALKQKTLQTITQLLDREAPNTAREERSRVIKEVVEEALGLGPLEDLLADPAVTEIMVNGHKRIFVEKAGKIQLSPVTFTSNQHLRNVIERIVTPLGRRIDEKTPYVDARLKDGSRVNAVIEPFLLTDPPSLFVNLKKVVFQQKNILSTDRFLKP